jgi:hypothetical protein
MSPAAKDRASHAASPSHWRVRPALVVALVASIALHVAWSLWPVTFNATPPPPPLTIALREMPPPPAPPPPPPPVSVTEPTPPPAAKPPVAPRRVKPRLAHRHHLASTPAPGAVVVPAPPEDEVAAEAPANSAPAHEAPAATPPPPPVVIGPPANHAKPPAALPPRLDLAYKVYFGTQGFMIGAATYRFEHHDDHYRVSTVAEPKGFAALFVHGRGLLESRGAITPTGLRPYELAIERGTSDKRETAYFNWDAGNVVLNDGSVVPFEPPAYDPLTILWQSYFSPPKGDEQHFTLVTPRRVQRYTFKLQAEEPLPWQDGEVMTQRWHQVSDDGKAEAWFWLAPSMHYVPVKMRIARTSRGTVEARLAAIRTDPNAPDVDKALGPDVEPIFKPADPTAPMPGPDNTGG